MCNLSPGPPGDAFGAVGATAKVSVKSGDDPMMAIQNATLNHQVLTVVNGVASLPSLPAGDNQLDLVLTSGSTGDEVVLVEQCAGGTTKDVSRSFVGGGNNPVSGFNIHA